MTLKTCLFFLSSITIIGMTIVQVKSAPSHLTPSRGSYTQSSYYYSDYTLPLAPKKSFLPGPQHCPETGRTVCAQVKPFYPIEEVFEVIKAAKAKRFNLSSEFMDEGDHDEEPRFAEPESPKYGLAKHNGYVVYQTVQYDQPQSYENFRSNNYVPMQQPFGYSQNQYNQNGYNNYNKNQVYQQERQNYQQNYEQPQRSQQLNSYASNQVPVYLNNYQQQYENVAVSHQFGRYKRQIAEDIDAVCSSRMILVEPKAALNDRGQWKFIVNLAEKDPRLKQAIKVEVCAQPNQQCSNQISLPFGFVSRCKQKYIKKKLLALDPTGQSTSSENFFAPSCCVCEIIRNNRK